MSGTLFIHLAVQIGRLTVWAWRKMNILGRGSPSRSDDVVNLDIEHDEIIFFRHNRDLMCELIDMICMSLHHLYWQNVSVYTINIEGMNS